MMDVEDIRKLLHPLPWYRRVDWFRGVLTPLLVMAALALCYTGLIEAYYHRRAVGLAVDWVLRLTLLETAVLVSVMACGFAACGWWLSLRK